MNMNVDFWNGKRVFVTGHTGFKGSWLTLILKKLGCVVAGYSLPPTTTPNLFGEIEAVNGRESLHENLIADILDYQKLKLSVSSFQPQIIIHLAAQPLVIEGYRDPLGTWSTNVIGSLNLLESCKQLPGRCAIVMVTTDKVYQNNEWLYGYRECDRLGGYDPYSASKAACEIAIDSWRNSFAGAFQTGIYPNLRIASARAGNVIGGGDWSRNRLVPDLIQSLIDKRPLRLRNPNSRRPWQHVIEPLTGYLQLAESLLVSDEPPCEAFNFGPRLESNESVITIAKEIAKFWNSDISIENSDNESQLHETSLLHLSIEKASHVLGWRPQWDLDTTLRNTSNWYFKFHKEKRSALECCNYDIDSYFDSLLN